MTNIELDIGISIDHLRKNNNKHVIWVNIATGIVTNPHLPANLRMQYFDLLTEAHEEMGCRKENHSLMSILK